MPFSRFVENQITAAIQRGEFDNLPNAGQPLNNDEYFSAPPDMRMAYSILKNANCVPTEVELMNEIARLREAAAGASDPDVRRNVEQTLAHRQTQLAIMLERRPARDR